MSALGDFLTNSSHDKGFVAWLLRKQDATSMNINLHTSFKDWKHRIHVHGEIPHDSKVRLLLVNLVWGLILDHRYSVKIMQSLVFVHLFTQSFWLTLYFFFLAGGVLCVSMYYNAKSLKPGGQKTIVRCKRITPYTQKVLEVGFLCYALPKKIPTQR